MTVTQTTSPVEKLKRRLSGISNLPTPPLVFSQISKVVSDPHSTVREISALLAEDPAISAKVLRLSNSAFYGVPQEITQIKQAVLILGLEAIKSLVLSSAVFEMFKSHKMDTEFQEWFWRHSLATAIASRLIVKHSQSDAGLDPEVSFSAGLLHDIGKLIICCFMPEDHKEIGKYLSEHETTRCQAEEQVAGFTHPLVGDMLAESWKLPKSIRTAIRDHHSSTLDDSPNIDYAGVVHIGNYLAKKTFQPEVLRVAPWEHIRISLLRKLNFTDDTIELFCQKLRDEYSNSSTFIQLALAS